MILQKNQPEKGVLSCQKRGYYLHLITSYMRQQSSGDWLGRFRLVSAVNYMISDSGEKLLKK